MCQIQAAFPSGTSGARVPGQGLLALRDLWVRSLSLSLSLSLSRSLPLSLSLSVRRTQNRCVSSFRARRCPPPPHFAPISALASSPPPHPVLPGICVLSPWFGVCARPCWLLSVCACAVCGVPCVHLHMWPRQRLGDTCIHVSCNTCIHVSCNTCTHVSCTMRACWRSGRRGVLSIWPLRCRHFDMSQWAFACFVQAGGETLLLCRASRARARKRVDSNVRGRRVPAPRKLWGWKRVPALAKVVLGTCRSQPKR